MSHLGTGFLSLPDFDNAISRGGDYKALGGLESRNISNDVVVTHRKGFWATAGCVLSGSAFLLTVDLLVRSKGDGSEDQPNINVQKTENQMEMSFRPVLLLFLL